MASPSSSPGNSLSPPEQSRHASLQEIASQGIENPSRSSSTGDLQQLKHKGRERPRVRFTPGGESLDISNQRTNFPLRGRSNSPPPKPLPEPRLAAHQKHPTSSISSFHPSLLDSEVPGDVTQEARSPFPGSAEGEDRWGSNGRSNRATFSQATAQERAQRLAEKVSAPNSRNGSLTVSPNSSPPLRPSAGIRLDDIPLMDWKEKRHYDDSTDEEEDNNGDEAGPSKQPFGTDRSEAFHLVRAMTKKPKLHRVPASSGLQSGQVTPVEERDPHNYVPRPKEHREGILASLLKLYDRQGMGAAIGGNMPSGPGVQTHHYHDRGSGHSTDSPTPADSPNTSGKSTPKARHPKWYDKSPNQSTTSLAGLISSSSMMASPGASFNSSPNFKPQRPGMKEKKGSGFSGAIHKAKKPRLEDEIHITVHIAEILSRQKYLLKLCRALMAFGAPTHRLEEYMRMTARVLEIDSQFLYLPGTMLCSFDDATTHTTEVKLVRTSQGVDLGKLYDVHEIYKEVVHDLIGVEEGTQRLDAILKAKQRYSRWILVGVYGLASAAVGPFAFQMRPIDMPVAFLLGSLLGILQLIIAPKSDLYSNVFEISAAVLTSFLARAFGSIRRSDGTRIFCFAALAQSSIALILPGYMILTGSLELQSRSLVAGSVRMVYALIYSLFLGFGITLGTTIYGLIDSNATSQTDCPVPDYSENNPYILTFPFVPLFTVCLIVINQAKWKQAPMMLVISFAGYVVNFFSVRRFTGNSQVANTLGALAIGVLANLYSRLRHGVAAAAMLPAIFVQVPSGLAASGALVSGVASADQITANVTGNYTVPNNGAQAAQQGAITTNIGYGMIQVSIGITVGLFLSALVVYPFGKKRSALFSF